MLITIYDTKKIADFKREFNTLYPFLKLEFFTKPSETSLGNGKKVIIPETKTFGECGATYNGGGIEVLPEMTVRDFESFFKTYYGLLVQVFRKSGKVWLETSLTNSWSLEQQNRHGEALNKH